MSERSIYLRDEAAKCPWHADRMTELETQAALRLLAARYAIARSAALTPAAWLGALPDFV